MSEQPADSERPQAQGLADQFRQTIDAVIALVERCDDELWARPTAIEGWPVGTVAHHIAVATPHIMGWVRQAASGQPITDTEEIVLAANEVHATHAYTRESTLARLRRDGDAAYAEVAALTDEQLARRVPLGLREDAMISTKSVIVRILLHHPHEHLASMQATVEGQERHA